MEGGAGGGCDPSQIDTDPTNCGACGRPCSTDGVDMLACSAGLCTSTCIGGNVNLSFPAAPTADDGCETPGRRVFLSSAPIFPDFGSALLGDAGCQAFADGAALGGVWASWTSDATTSPSARFVQSTVPYMLVDGTVVANDWADITDGILAHAIDQDELGTTPGSVEVWTGSDASGVPHASDPHCEDWTSQLDTSTAAVGIAHVSITAFEWSFTYSQFCDRDNVRLYCFEQ